MNAQIAIWGRMSCLITGVFVVGGLASGVVLWWLRARRHSSPNARVNTTLPYHLHYLVFAVTVINPIGV